MTRPSNAELNKKPTRDEPSVGASKRLTATNSIPSPTQIREAEQGGLDTPEDTAKHSHNQAAKLLEASVPYKLERGGIYLIEVKQYAMNREMSALVSNYYRNRYQIDIQFVFTTGDEFALKAVPAIKADTPVTDLATNSPNTNTDLSNPQEQRIAEYKQLLTEIPEDKLTYNIDFPTKGKAQYNKGYSVGYTDALWECRAIIQARIKEME